MNDNINKGPILADSDDEFPMTRVNAGHYTRKIGTHTFETYRTDSVVDGAQGRPVGHVEWFAAVDGEVVAQGRNNKSVKKVLIEYAAKAEANAMIQERRDSARLVFTEVFGDELPVQVKKALDKAYGELVDVLPPEPKKTPPKKRAKVVKADPEPEPEPTPEPEPVADETPTGELELAST